MATREEIINQKIQTEEEVRNYFNLYFERLKSGAGDREGARIRFQDLKEEIFGEDFFEVAKLLTNSFSTDDTISAPIIGYQLYTINLLKVRSSLFQNTGIESLVVFGDNSGPKAYTTSRMGLSSYIDEAGKRRYGYEPPSFDNSGYYFAPKYNQFTDPVDFFRILKPADKFESKDAREYAEILNKLIANGFLDLLYFRPLIQQLAGKRFVNKDSVERSALNALSETGQDFEWVTIGIKLYNKLLVDPILAWQMSQYFPTLAQFIFTTLAATADYSNEGAGGSIDDPLNDPVKVAKMMFESFGVDEEGNAVFKPAWTLINTALRIQQALDQFPFRANLPPRTPDIFHLRIGAANFYVPPVSISVNTAFRAGSLTGGAIRQKNTPKFNTGYKDTVIGMRLYFPNYEEIWGISIDDAGKLNLKSDFNLDFSKDSEEKIDKFLSSLRGLVAAFKASPILPIKNQYVNNAHGITGVGLVGMTVSTIPNFPFCLVVDLEMVAFNHKPFLPMIRDFNQAIHWGKYRHYMGKAALDLDRYINKSFLIDMGTPLETESTSGKWTYDPTKQSVVLVDNAAVVTDTYDSYSDAYYHSFGQRPSDIRSSAR